MRKFLKGLFVLGLLVVLSNGAYARKIVGSQVLQDSTSANGLWSDYVMTASTVCTSAGISTKRMSKDVDSAALLITKDTEDGTLAIHYEVSVDNVTFYEPLSTTDTTVSTVETNLASSRWIEFDPPVAPYMRFSITSSTTPSTVTAVFIYQEEN